LDVNLRHEAAMLCRVVDPLGFAVADGGQLDTKAQIAAG
jgi:hypothetical protein